MTKKLHILFLSSWFPSRVNPANGDFVLRHAEAVATKHKVTIIHVVTDENLKADFEISTSKHNNITTVIRYVHKFNNSISKLFQFFNAYKKCIQEIGHYDIVHHNITFPIGLMALYLKWFKKKPFIVSEHWSGYQTINNNIINGFEKLITKVIIKNAVYICPVSENLKNHMLNFGLQGNYKPIPNVVNTNYFKPREVEHKEFIITHVSSMDNEPKNIVGILNVISRLQHKIPSLKFNLVGDNSIKYLDLINNLKIINYKLIGQISNQNVAKYIETSDVFVLFSNYENLPCVILESFACGVPVISTDVGGIHEYFPKDFGTLIPPKDELALENAILKIYNSQIIVEKEKMHLYAKNNFGVSVICNSFTKLYYKSIKN